jgi:hypothetical protein
MSAMIRTLAKARLLNTGHQVMKQTLIRKYNTNTNFQRQSKFRDIDKGKLFVNSQIVGAVLGGAVSVKMYKDDIGKSGTSNPRDFGRALSSGVIMGGCYYVSVPIYLVYSCVNRVYYKRLEKNQSPESKIMF